MSVTNIARRPASLTTLLLGALLLLAMCVSAPAGAANEPHVSTGDATHARGSSIQLTGSVTPDGSETSYYFQYGPTTAYGSQTPKLSAGSGSTKTDVGQVITGLTPALTYHFRLVAVTTSGKVVNGNDKSFVAGGAAVTRLAFTLSKADTTDVYGSPFVVSGTLTGAAGANHVVELQASPYPYTSAFTTVGAPGMTNAAGAFSFRVTNLTMSTQFRVITLDKLPVYSKSLTEHLALHVILHIAKTRRQGVVRFYGAVAPSKTGATITFRVQKASRPHGHSESTVKELPVAFTKLVHGSTSYSRFNAIVEITKAGRYTAAVKETKGPYASGTSNSFVIHTTVPPRTHRPRRERRVVH